MKQKFIAFILVLGICVALFATDGDIIRRHESLKIMETTSYTSLCKLTLTSPFMTLLSTVDGNADINMSTQTISDTGDISARIDYNDWLAGTVTWLRDSERVTGAIGIVSYIDNTVLKLTTLSIDDSTTGSFGTPDAIETVTPNGSYASTYPRTIRISASSVFVTAFNDVYGGNDLAMCSHTVDAAGDITQTEVDLNIETGTYSGAGALCEMGTTGRVLFVGKSGSSETCAAAVAITKATGAISDTLSYYVWEASPALAVEVCHITDTNFFAVLWQYNANSNIILTILEVNTSTGVITKSVKDTWLKGFVGVPQGIHYLGDGILFFTYQDGDSDGWGSTTTVNTSTGALSKVTIDSLEYSAVNATYGRSILLNTSEEAVWMFALSIEYSGDDANIVTLSVQGPSSGWAQYMLGVKPGSIIGAEKADILNVIGVEK